MKNVLAFDYGASSGRAILGSFDGEKIKIKEVHRFKNKPVYEGETLYWDFSDLYKNLRHGIVKGFNQGKIDSISIDTWGVDFGLINKEGRLLEKPVHYRDARTMGMMEEAFKIVPQERLYHMTGIQMLNFNTIFQLLYLLKNRPELLNKADKMLLMPDLFNYFLTGDKLCEHTIASTTQLFSIDHHNWSYDLIKEFGFPEKLFANIVDAGAVSGRLSSNICNELGVSSCDVVSVASHDTASAVAAVPAEDEDFVYISSGTWSLMGIESSKPYINDKTRQYNFTNEGGYGHTIRFLKNIMGLWIIQECQRQWLAEAPDLTFDQLSEEAVLSKPFEFAFNPNAEKLLPPGDMAGRVKNLCYEAGMKNPETRGQITRAVYENLAFFYRKTLEEIEEVTGRHFSQINVVGGGSQADLIMQFTANATGRTVVAGPVEATAAGNITVQLIASGELQDLKEAREIIRRSFELKYYYPEKYEIWDEIYQSRRSIYD